MKIAILLSERPDLGWLWRAKELAAALRQTGAPNGGEITVAIGLPRESEAEWRKKEAELLTEDSGVVVRHLGWERVEPAMAQRMFPDLKASRTTFPMSPFPATGDGTSWTATPGSYAPTRRRAPWCR